MRWLALVLLVGCSDGSGPGRDPANLNGTWIGPLTNTAEPDVTFRATLRLTMVADGGGAVEGTLSINDGRTAIVTTGQVDGGTLVASLEYTLGTCSGTIDLEAEAAAADTQLVGTYVQNDCEGGSEGSFTLARQ